ncbi:hypothetical protein AB0E52_00375 [Micrococcus luteus]|uniref:hypothetical protein n=1 Tax=Micrococcus luteus TaxID=1270 RepID=UPI0021B3339F|nr:hypothetical protein [Micrococcus luteus]
MSAGSDHTLGLTEDSRVLAAGDDSHGQCRVQEWRGIVAIAAGSSHSLGLRSDGVILTTGDDAQGQCRWALAYSPKYADRGRRSEQLSPRPAP